jgi:hypothetical protein
MWFRRRRRAVGGRLDISNFEEERPRAVDALAYTDCGHAIDAVELYSDLHSMYDAWPTGIANHAGQRADCPDRAHSSTPTATEELASRHAVPLGGYGILDLVLVLVMESWQSCPGSRMTGRRDRPFQDRSATELQSAHTDEVRPNELSEEERAWLAERISWAADRAFPAGEPIGTDQQDFYFRKLIELLIENTSRYGTVALGGNYLELWGFTREKEREWRQEDKSRRHRSGYARGSIKGLVYQWKAAFGRRVRVARTGNATIEFVLRTPSVRSDDLILRARVMGLQTPSGRTIVSEDTAATDLTRLPPPIASELDTEERRRLLLEAGKYARRIEADYLTKLTDAPTEFIQEQLKELRRAKKNKQRLALAILAVVSTAMVAYRVFFAPRPIPLAVLVSRDGAGYLTSVFVDGKGHVSLKSEPAVSEKRHWWDMIIDPKGTSVRGENGSRTVHVMVPPGQSVGYTYEVPRNWHEQPDVVLQPDVLCSKTSTSNRSVVCFILVDVRSIAPSLTTRAVGFSILYGDGKIATEVPSTEIDFRHTRTLLAATHSYSADGAYRLSLCESSDKRVISHTYEGGQQPPDMLCAYLGTINVDHSPLRLVREANVSPDGRSRDRH